MEDTLICDYCSSPVTIICNCSPDQALLCEDHMSKHIGEQPGKLHGFRKPYLPLQPNEQEAIHSAETFLLNSEQTQKWKLTIEHSLETRKILEELAKITNILLRQLKDLNQTHLNKLEGLTWNMTEMRTALSKVGRLGVPYSKETGSVQGWKHWKGTIRPSLAQIFSRKSRSTGSNKGWLS